MKKLVPIVLVLFFVAVNLFSTEPLTKITPALEDAIANIDSVGEKIPIYIRLTEQYDSQKLYQEVQHLSRTERRAYTVNTLKTFSEETQRNLKIVLQEMERTGLVTDLQFIWITNIIALEATVDAIRTLEARDDVAGIIHNPLEDVLFTDSFRNKRRDDLDRDEKNVNRAIAEHVNRVRAPQVWNQGYQGEGVVVAVLDTGVNYNHRDLVNRMWTHPQYPNHGYNFSENNNNPMDGNGHGSHCAGTVSGDGSAGTETGVAPGSEMMALKVLNNQGSGSYSNVIRGIGFAAENGADVLSLSLGFRNMASNQRSEMRTAFVNCLSAGVVAAVAVGNEGASGGIPNNTRTPGNCPPPWLHPDQTLTGGLSAVVSVGATDNSDSRASFSSKGPVTWGAVSPFNDYPYNPGMGLIVPDIMAPGVNNNSLRHNSNSGYVRNSGTSMACPVVAGVMALMLSKDPAMLPEEVSQIIEETAVSKPASKNNEFGSGRIDALNVINAVVGTKPPNPPVRPIPEDGAQFIGSKPLLGWSNGGGARSYKVYLGTDNPPTNAVNGAPTENRDYQVTNNLSPKQTYYWRIDAINENGARAGTVWSFETSTPNKATDPEPANTAIGVRVMPLLRWFPGGGATKYAVYLGTDNPPSNVLNGDVTEETYFQVINDLEPYTEHFWRTDAINDNGVTNGDVWSFTTSAAPGEGFESGDFSKYPWKTDYIGQNTGPWFVTEDESFSGKYSARSAVSGSSTVTTLSITMELFRPGAVRFARKVSSQLSDHLRFYIDGIQQAEWSGELDWDEFSFPIGVGRKVLSWEYQKSASGSAGQDAAWIDDVTFPELTVPEPILLPPHEIGITMKLDHISVKWGLPQERPVLLGYYVYRSIDNEDDFNLINGDTYLSNMLKDYVTETGTYSYYVTSVYENGESDPSKKVSVTVKSAISSPIFEPEEGEYPNPIEVELHSIADEAVIYYTIDGSEPTTESMLYEFPFLLEESALVKARAFKINHLPSEVIEKQYIIVLSVEDEYQDKLSSLQVFPNPLFIGNHGAKGVNIALNIRENQTAKVQIYNIKGQLVKELEASENRSLLWDMKDSNGRAVSTGIYLINVNAGSQQITKRLMILN